MEDERQRLGRLAMGELGVRASFSLSYRQLEPEAARTFRLLSLLGMPEISVRVAAAVTDRELAGVEAALEQLADAALMEALTPGRYRFHDLLRLFARERAEAEESAEKRRAAVSAGVDWYLAHVLEAAVLLGPARFVERTPVFAGLADALAWLDLERENLVRAVVAAGEHDGGRRRARPGRAVLADGRCVVPLLRVAPLPDRLAAGQRGRPARGGACRPA